MAVPAAGAGAGDIAIELDGAVAGAPPGAGVIAVELEGAGAVAGAAEPSELAAGEPAGAAAGVELLHPLNTKTAERAKLAAMAGNFSRMGFSC
jgi:hypothetical protein